MNYSEYFLLMAEIFDGNVYRVEIKWLNDAFQYRISIQDGINDQYFRTKFYPSMFRSMTRSWLQSIFDTQQVDVLKVFIFTKEKNKNNEFFTINSGMFVN